ASESPAYRPHGGRPAVFHLAFFGGATVAGVEGPITGRATQRHRMALLALLASTKRLSRKREQVITLLWPDTDAERGCRLLSDSIYRVNRTLGGDAIVGAGDDIRLNRERVTSDVAAF